jgi:outer membrane biosynthesis protein TonB
MRNAVIISGSLHLAVFAAAWASNPFSSSAPLEVDQVIAIEVAVLAESPVPPAPKKASPKAPPKPPPPKAKNVVPAAKPPPPTPEPTPKAAEKPVPAPETLKVAAVKLKEKPLPQKKLPPKPVLKPEKPDDFMSVLKTVENLKKAAPQEAKPTKPLSEVVADALKRHQVEPQQKLARLGSSLTMTERDSVRRQIERCWNVPAGARDAENLVVHIRLRLNADGTVIRAELVDGARAAGDTFFRAAAESALRAVLSCSPLRLPPKKYEEWKNMVLSFNPRDMFR